MTRVYRDSVAGKTWIDRGSGTQVLVLPDHGDPHWQWSAPAEPPVWDDELFATEAEELDGQRDRYRRALTEAVAGSDIPAAAKATIRKIIGEVIV